MKSQITRLLGLLTLTLALAACSSIPSPLPPSPTAPPPTPTPMPLPASYSTLESYLKAWEERRYGEMYDLLSKSTQATITKERFVQRYTAIAEGSTVLAVKGSFTRDEALAKAEGYVSLPFSVTFSTARLGEIKEDNTLPLVFEEGRWRVTWTPSLIFRELTEDSRILFEPLDPKRGTILDRKGRPLATQGNLVSVGVQPSLITDEAKLLSVLQQELKIDSNQAKAAFQRAQPDWFVPLRTLPAAQVQALRPKLEAVPGVIFQNKPARVYPAGNSASHIVGYVTRVTEEDLKKLAAKGYGEEDFVGRAGIEAWAEDTLAGERGGRLQVVSTAGKVLTTIAEKPAKDGQDVHLSLDLDVQKLAESSLGQQPGSVVIQDVQNNLVLAMASFPRFDPNGFVLGFSEEDWKKLNDDPQRPFQDRAAASSYPTGSVFKVVTMAAGLDRGGFTKDDQFDDNGKWTGLGNGIVLGDWLPGGHGRLSLFEGLVESCNIVFYEIGKKLDSIDPKILPTFARGFGFGQPTGINGVQEAAGLVPDPDWKQKEKSDSWYLGDSVNLGIGQGFFLATPLQVSNAYAAIARGGALMTPVLVANKAGESVQFKTQQKGTLPVQPATLETIRQAMRLVTSDPRGTAYYAFQGSKLSISAKTGSAEYAGPDSHAWFAGYAPADQPQIAIVVMVEGKGHGAEFAAPVARKVLEGYFR